MISEPNLSLQLRKLCSCEHRNNNQIFHLCLFQCFSYKIIFWSTLERFMTCYMCMLNICTGFVWYSYSLAHLYLVFPKFTSTTRICCSLWQFLCHSLSNELLGNESFFRKDAGEENLRLLWEPKFLPHRQHSSPLGGILGLSNSISTYEYLRLF
jgi:hypothetical protein